MRTLQTPEMSHLEFDELCQEIDEFDPLPDPATNLLASETPVLDPESPDPIPRLDDRILAGLVSPL